MGRLGLIRGGGLRCRRDGVVYRRREAKLLFSRRSESFAIAKGAGGREVRACALSIVAQHTQGPSSAQQPDPVGCVQKGFGRGVKGRAQVVLGQRQLLQSPVGQRADVSGPRKTG